MSQDAHNEPNAGGEDEPVILLDLALILAENLKLLIVVPLAAGIVALGIGFLITPTYTATARLLPPTQQQSASAAIASQLGPLAGLIGGAAGIKSTTDQYVSLLKSRTVLDAMVERFKLKELYKTELTVDARRALEGAIRVSAGLRDNIITVEVDDRDPARAADMTNALIDELRNLTNTLAVTEAGQRRLFFDTQLKQAQNNLTKAEITLRTSGVNEATLRTVPQSTLEAIARLRAQITAQEIKLASMRTYMTDTNAELRVALQELGALKSELLKVEQNTVANAGGGEGAQYISRYRDFKYHETLFELMAKQYELARLDEAREGVVIQVVDAAKPPERKSRPRKAVTAVLTTVVVLFLTMLFVLMRHALRNAAQNPGFSEKLERLRRLLLLRRA